MELMSSLLWSLSNNKTHNHLLIQQKFTRHFLTHTHTPVFMMPLLQTGNNNKWDRDVNEKEGGLESEELGGGVRCQMVGRMLETVY